VWYRAYAAFSGREVQIMAGVTFGVPLWYWESGLLNYRGGRRRWGWLLVHAIGLLVYAVCGGCCNFGGVCRRSD